MIMARTGRQLAIRTYLVSKRLQAFRPPTWDIHTGCPMSEVCHPKSKVLSPRPEVRNPKLEVRSPKSDVLFRSVSARKATSLCAVHLSRLSAFDQETRHFQNCRLNVKRQLADNPLCRTARYMSPLMSQIQTCRQPHLQNRSDPTKIGLPIYIKLQFFDNLPCISKENRHYY